MAAVRETSFAVRRGAASVFLIMFAALVLAFLVLLIAWLIEPEPLKVRSRHRGLDITELVTPGVLTDQERLNSGTTPDGSNIVLEDGAWVQVAGEDGTLAQQYSAQKIDPLPDGWMEMERPRSMMYLDSGRIMTLRGEHGLLSVPNQAIESGTLDGDVVIRLFIPKDGAEIDITQDEPEIIIRTEEAAFDNALGEIRCDKSIRIDTREASFAGVGLTVLIGRSGNTIERLMVERSTAPIRILRKPTTQVTSATTKPASTVISSGRSENSSAQEVANSSDSKTPLFYQLTLEDNVEVRQFASAKAPSPNAILRGDSLLTVFSLDGDAMSTLGPDSERTPPEPVTGDAPPVISANDFLGASVLGAPGVDPEPLVDPDSELIEISYDGRLVMIPAAPDRWPGSVDDITFELQAVNRPVEVIDAKSNAVATCARLSYRTDTERVQLVGDELRPLVVDSPQMTLDAERFWLVRSLGEAAIEGAGKMVFSNQGADGTQLQINWSGQVGLQFEPGTDQLDSARFEREVQVANKGFTFQSELMEVFFEHDASDQPLLSRILSSGGPGGQVRANRLGEVGELLADQVELQLDVDGTGDPIPRQLNATGSVRARDEQQTIWTDDLDVRFVADDSEEGFQLGRIKALRGVQVLLENGARAWAERLDGDGLKRQVMLSADDGDLVLVRGNVISDQLHSVRFDDETQVAQTNGPGRFRLFDDPLDLPARGAVEVPGDLSASPSLEATWARMMLFDDRSNGGAGSLELVGDVMVRNVPDQLEQNDLDAGFLRLDFLEHESAPVIDSAGNVSSQDVQAAFSNSRELGTLTARGDARLENRSWSGADHDGDPDLFRIQGADIVYQANSGNAIIRGPGTMLINRVPREEKRTGSSTSDFGLGGDGTSRFSWTDGMAMEQQVADRFKITMIGGVEVLHAGLLPADTMSMRSNSLDILVNRPLKGSDDVAQGDGSQQQQLDLGGQATILRVTADDRVFVRTPDQDVETDFFDYDVTNGIAHLTGRAGRPVTLVSRQSPTPVRASEMTWDMRSGRIQITGAQGSAGR